MNQSLEEFVHQGSNWILDGVHSMELFTLEYSPISGSSYMELPLKIRFTRGVVNVKNTDNKCFLWSILARLHQIERNPQQLFHYKRYENELDMNGIEFPVTLDKITKFEKQNNISVNVFCYEKGETFPLYLTKLANGCREVDLLYLSDEHNQHYCWIKDLNKFLRSTNKHNSHFYCRRCLYGFTKKSLLDAHRPYCDKVDFQKVKYPESGKDDVEFKNFHKQMRIGFAIYADFECINKKINSKVSKTCTHLVEFEACGYSYQVVCSNDDYTKPPVVYRGENSVVHFLEDLSKEETWIRDILNNQEPLIMSTEAEENFQKALKCYICERTFNESLLKVRDHDHLGLLRGGNSTNYTNYRGASCQRCNLNLKNPSYIPIIMHNLRGFDSHPILSAVGKYQRDMKVIPNSMEKYISFEIDNLRFLDSYQFMSSSLETLIDNLAQDGLKHFKNFKKAFPDEAVAKLLLRKNVYCYDYIDSHEKFGETSLPSKEAFYNRLKEEHISQEDYEYVQEVWDTLNMKTLGDLHDNYVKCDAVLLADVMERFRDMCLENYSLDCLHYYTSPGLSYDAALKMTGVSLDLITDPMMYSLFDLQTRGGISVVTRKYAAANNPDIEETYNPKEPNKYIMYFDANNLYGYAMSKPLPIGYMRFLSDDEIESLDVRNIPSDGSTGYVLEVDLEYPNHLHDSHNDYPLAPTHTKVTDEELSPYSQSLWKELMKPKFENLENQSEKREKTPSRTKVSKLMCTLQNKNNCVLHFETLKLYLKLGLKVTKIHKVIEFQKRPWLKKYIDFNSKKRSLAKNDFEKDFYKLMCNSVYGKTMENVKGRIDVKIVSDPQKLKKLVAKPSFKRLKIFNENLVGVEMKKVTIELNRPAYLGAQILDISKNLMTSFHHEVMKPRYEQDIALLFTDTDSLCYEIKTEDVYRDMKEMIHHFDTSNYSEKHQLYSTTYKKVPGKFKDECNGVMIKEFVGLRPKMYSILRADDEEKLTTKGITRTAKNHQLRHENFKNCLFNNITTRHDMKMIRSESHQLYIDNVCKKGLSNFDDKRYWLGVKSLAFGHYKINNNK